MTSRIVKNPDQIRDVKNLREAFYRVFDASAISSALRSKTPKYRPIGAGTHFEALLLAARPEAPADALRLVAKIPQSRFFPETDPQARTRWLAALDRLRQLALPMIPPFEVVDLDESLALVMPFAPDRLESAAPHWQPVSDRLADTRAALRSHRLGINDTLQGGSWRSIPFIYDFSDLRQVG